MFNLRDYVIFFAGAAFLHTISHIFFSLFVPLPLNFKVMVLTTANNMWFIIISSIVTILLIWWAVHLSKKMLLLKK